MTDHPSVLTFYNNKALRHPERLRSYAQGEPIIPLTLDIDLTDACNNLCPGCAGGRGEANAMLETDMVKKLLEEAAGLGVRSVVFTGGGEPTLHPQLAYLISLASAHGLATGLVTNAMMFDKHPALVEAVLEHCTWVRCSLDASDAAMYELTHGMDGFQRAVDGIRALVEGRRSRDAKSPTLGVAYLTGPVTIDGLADAGRTVRDLGVDYLYFRPFLGDRTPVDIDALRRVFNTDTFEVMGALAYSRFHERERPYTTCGFGWWVSVVKANGEVTWCCHTRQQPEAHLGDLHADSLATILARRADNVVNWARCPMFCRGDHLNRFLEDMQKPLMHEEFL
jgi:MoaA/NifB/PqqE/SkfB family radical SAM enzyme